MRNLAAFVTGAVFGIGLLLSGMTNTVKVQGWLDIFGDWDPTLAFVMGGAIIPMAIAWRYAEGRKPVLADRFPPKPDPRLGSHLVIGSTLFGMGWGLAGLCPGPAIAALGFGGTGVVVFVIAMLAGMYASPAVQSRLDRAAASL